MSTPVLALNDIRFAYNGTPVLAGVSLTAAKGEVTAMMGPSGCGKSTLIGIAAGLIEPTGGAIRRDHARASVMFQDPLLLPWRTALDNVAFALKSERLAAPERRNRARAILAEVGLTGEDVEKYPRQLSGGMRQRAALARALVVRPDLVLLDEPFSGLDAALSEQMLALVRAFVERDGVSALVVTHDAREAARFAERVYVLSAGPARVVSYRRLDGRPSDAADRRIEADAKAILADIAAATV